MQACNIPRMEGFVTLPFMLHSILIASRRSGLSSHVIRAWEKRYRVLAPSRCEKNRRMYCDEDIERLKILRELTQRGHRISQVAELCTDTLRQRLEQDQVETQQKATCSADLNGAEDYVKACCNAMAEYDADTFRSLLNKARNDLGYRAALRQVVIPVIQHVGAGWRSGGVRMAQEHLQSVVVREFLSSPIPGANVPPNAPEIIVTTPAGTSHELGALLVAATSRDLGWRVTYLGPSLPAEEIAHVAVKRRARAVALSLVYPLASDEVKSELLRLQGLLPADCTLIIGGKAASSYRQVMPLTCTARWTECLDSFESLITDLT